MNLAHMAVIIMNMIKGNDQKSCLEQRTKAAQLIAIWCGIGFGNYNWIFYAKIELDYHKWEAGGVKTEWNRPRENERQEIVIDVLYWTIRYMYRWRHVQIFLINT